MGYRLFNGNGNSTMLTVFSVLSMYDVVVQIKSMIIRKLGFAQYRNINVVVVHVMLKLYCFVPYALAIPRQDF